MISRLMHDERTRQAARRARRCYQWSSAVLMLVLIGYGAWVVVKAVLP